MRRIFQYALLGLAGLFAGTPLRAAAERPAIKQGEFVARDFHFNSGETLPELRLHYRTLGQPARNAQGRVTNAVLILHGTSGSGEQFFQPQFAGELFGSGQLLDARRYYIILPDDVGHGHSSKPSDGLRMKFPQYDYADMVRAQYDLVTEGLGVNHLRLVMGTSMGCMHSWLWGETYPDFVDALMPLACQPAPISGRNRLWRKMLMDAITQDPAWQGGQYAREPREGLRTALDLFLIVTSAPMTMQRQLPTAEAADKFYEAFMRSRLPDYDANDLLYQVNASRDYDPSKGLGKITARVMAVNSADDFINPPELGITPQLIKRVKHGRFILIPASPETHGHGTHTWAVFWEQYLAELLKELAR